MAAGETGMTAFVSNILKSETYDEAFNCFMVHNSEQERRTATSHQEELAKLLSSCVAQDTVDTAIRSYISQISTQRSRRHMRLLFQLLETAVLSNVIPAKLVCDALLTNDLLSHQNEELWCQTFSVILRIISGVDYKGVRDMLKIIFDKASRLPDKFNSALLPQINALEKLVHFIFDRNNSLLPAYFIANELQKLYPESKIYPHWRLAGLLSKFMESFTETAQMVSVIGRSKLFPIVGHTGTVGNVWKLDPGTLKFQVKGSLPFDQSLLQPQTSLIRYVLEQPYSRDTICIMLNLNKQNKLRCQMLEEQLVDLVVIAMEKAEIECAENSTDENGTNLLTWQHLSSQLIYFVLFQFASFPEMVTSLQQRLMEKNLRKGRDHLMWVLLQFISGSIQKNPVSDFIPVMKLYDFLYADVRDVFPVPDITKPICTHQMAAAIVWIHLMKKAQTDQIYLNRQIPHALYNHIEFLQQSLMQTLSWNPSTDYKITLLCNAYSTNPECFQKPMGVLADTIYANQKSQTLLPGTNCFANGPTQPLSMNVLDSLTVHAKMSLIHNIVTHIVKLAQTKSTLALAPALVETYSRLLVYIEIESLGIKGFISQLLPTVFKSHAWGILHTLLEMFSYRLHHIHPHYRVQLLSSLHSLAAVPQTNLIQLHLCVESTALRLITGLGSAEVQPQLSRFHNEPKSLLSAESEELNRALVLTLARSMHITGVESMSGGWWKDILTTIMQNTPHSWSSFTLSCFPQPISEFFCQFNLPKENKAQLKRSVEEEYRKWKSMSNENDIITHFSLQGTPPLFICLLWKMLLENDRISPIAYKVLERVGARSLSAHMRTFADFLVFEFANSGGGQHVNKCIDALNDLIWKCNVLTLDRLVLCLALRSFEGNEAQVCFFIIQLLLLKPNDFRTRVNEFTKENTPEHWKQSNWHEKHLAFHRKFPEKFFYETQQDLGGQSAQQQNLPVYFGNVCLRFLPVFDIVIHRFLELPPVTKSLETLLEHLSGLYKFHDRPITYLYSTLHYYEQKLKERPVLKRRLVSSILGSLKTWYLSDAYAQFVQRQPDDINWIPEPEYYVRLVQKLVDTMSDKCPFPNIDWRFNEFSNAAALVLHCTCIELMALPVASHTVGMALIDVVLKGHTLVSRHNTESWMNAVGLIINTLPECYWSILNEQILEMFQSSLFSIPGRLINLFQHLNFQFCHSTLCETPSCILLALSHALWHHASVTQLGHFIQFIQTKLKPVVRTEEQYIYICHMLGPFLLRLLTERPRCIKEVMVLLYEMLEAVDKSCERLNYMDSICDLLYYIKYTFIGDAVKSEVERIIRNLRPALQLRLRFITHLNLEEVMTT
ncbi:Mediator of RNA polymerase II transcription subunit 23 [Chamberlinius hualienensis]